MLAQRIPFLSCTCRAVDRITLNISHSLILVLLFLYQNIYEAEQTLKVELKRKIELKCFKFMRFVLNYIIVA